jgi:CubicO group peptidase (beta-lactamase class C family)
VPRTWNRTETWLALFVVAVGGLLAAIAGLRAYMTMTATPLHPDQSRVPSASHAEPSQRWAAAVGRARQATRAHLAEANLPGVSVAVGIDGEIVWAEGFGWADIDDRIPVTPATRFRIGTASTLLTSAAVGLLLEQGRVKLDDEIQVYVPELPKKPWPVTVRQVMGHVAGLRNDGGDEGPLLSTPCERPVEGLQVFAESSLLFEPGTAYRYSSYGWIVMSAVVETAADEPFLRFMRQQVFAPLGMDETRQDDATAGSSRRATAYFPRYAADPRYGLDLMRDVDYSCYAGASVFVSTPSDLVRFGLAMHHGRLLQPTTVRMLQTSQRLPSGAATGYGLGWDLETVSLGGTETQVVGHDGDLLGGPAASVMLFRERGLVVAVLSNTSYAATPALALTIADAFVR